MQNTAIDKNDLSLNDKRYKKDSTERAGHDKKVQGCKWMTV